jgi:hypothetical protein
MAAVLCAGPSSGSSFRTASRGIVGIAGPVAILQPATARARRMEYTGHFRFVPLVSTI